MTAYIDIQYAIRQLFKAPKFTAMTLGVLIGGLSISLFTFSFLFSTVYKELPLPEGDSAKSIALFSDGNYGYFTPYEFVETKKLNTSLQEFGIYDEGTVRLSVGQSGKTYLSALVGVGFFEFSRTRPILGRTFVEDDMVEGANPVALISEEVWKEELAGKESLEGVTLMLDGQRTDIIGVMPSGYRFPNIARIWLPFSNSILKFAPDNHARFKTFGRLKPGISINQAEAELSQITQQIYDEHVRLYQKEPAQRQVKFLTFQMAQTGGQGGIVFAFLNGVAWIILLLACINVGNLLLARILEKQKETAVRAALGAKSGRLISQLMWEGVLISTLGGVMSVLLVGAALDYTNIALQSWISSGGSFWWRYGMDWQTVAMAVVFTLVTILLSSFLPAWRSANQDINSTLRDGTRGAQSKKAGRISRILITTQVFLVALLMLIGSISAFIAHKFINLELGDNYNNVMTARFQIPEQKYVEPQQQLNLTLQLMERIKHNAKVSDVVVNNWIGMHKVKLAGVEYNHEKEIPLIDVISSIGSLDTIGVNMLNGREFGTQDNVHSRKVAVISDSMAKRYWPGESPLEKTFYLDIDDKTEKMFVVGVVTNRMNPSSLFGKLDSADEIYVSAAQFISSYQIFYYRTAPRTENADEIFYRAMFQTDRNIELSYAVAPAMKNRNKMRESMQLLSNITFGTGFFALLLALVGIYGLTANSVAQRTHEVGIRRAVGATDASIVRIFLRQGGVRLAIGLGLALAFFAVLAFGFHSFTEELFPIYSYYMLAFIVTIGLSIIVMLAIYFPTKKAIKMEPSAALRYE